MNLDYNILWFEDQKGWLEPNIIRIRKFFESLHFNAKFTCYEGDEDVDATIFNASDLVLMDFSLKSSISGDVIIKKIRDLDLYTDIIFYSQDLVRAKEKLHTEHIFLDGIYFSLRDGIVNKVEKVVLNSIKKLLDPNTIRGLAIGHTSILDAQLSRILRFFLETSVERKKVFLDKLKESRNLSFKILEKFDEKTSWENIEKCSDSYNNWRGLTRILRDEKACAPLLVKLKKYDHEILKVRNLLAHINEEDLINELQSHLQSEEANYESLFKQIREYLLKHKSNLDEINELIEK